jgi:hypothetical protein
MPSPDFRNQLDSILRTKNPEAVRQFLVAQGQWPENVANIERAMWLMIAGSPALREFHHEAQDWLISHGSQAEAEMLLERTKTSQTSSATPSPKAGTRPRKQNGGEQHSNTSSAKRSQRQTRPDHSPHTRSKPPKQP